MFTERNKIILSGLIASIVLIALGAAFAINKIQDELYEGYSGFGQLLTKTIAYQGYEISKGFKTNEEKYVAINNYAKSVLENNKDIAYISFRDENNNIFYTTPKNNNNAEININSPFVNKKGEFKGSIDIGLSADMASSVTKTTKNSMLMVFTFAWLAFSFILIVNAILATRELYVLHQGVKEITNGKFGTTLNLDKATSEIKGLYRAFNNMSEKLHLYEEQNIDTLTFEKNKLEAVLMGIANGVVVCSMDDKISLVNNSAAKILNTELKSLLNTKIQDFKDSEGKSCFGKQIEAFKEADIEATERKPLEFNVPVDTRIIKTIISPVFSKAHDYLGYIIILIDITTQAEIDKLKNDFISNVSHELRTPITVLRSYIDTLYNYGDSFKYEEQKEFIGTINEEIIRLDRMVRDILDFSKLESNTKYEKTKLNINETVENTISSIRILAEEKDITINIKKDENMPFVPFNLESIERVLINLMTNAIKHSNSGSKINVEVKKSGDWAEVTVQDFGSGIAPEHLERIFDRFYRVENDTHTIKGTGLGLHLVKLTVEKHHKGQVFVTSKVGEGSIFGFRLPLIDVSVKEKVEALNG